MSFGDVAREAYLGTLSEVGMKKGADIESGWLGNCGMGLWGPRQVKGAKSHWPKTAAASSAWKRQWLRW
jgi:hypothetical protein